MQEKIIQIILGHGDTRMFALTDTGRIFGKPIGTHEWFEEENPLNPRDENVGQEERSGWNWKEELKKLWSEHDGTHFYRDEFEELISKTLEQERREIENKIPLYRAGLLESGESREHRDGYNQALREVREIFTDLIKQRK